MQVDGLKDRHCVFEGIASNDFANRFSLLEDSVGPVDLREVEAGPDSSVNQDSIFAQKVPLQIQVPVKGSLPDPVVDDGEYLAAIFLVLSDDLGALIKFGFEERGDLHSVESDVELTNDAGFGDIFGGRTVIGRDIDIGDVWRELIVLDVEPLPVFARLDPDTDDPEVEQQVSGLMPDPLSPTIFVFERQHHIQQFVSESTIIYIERGRSSFSLGQNEGEWGRM